MKIALPLSKLDVKILKALESEGAKTSTRDLSKILQKPDRTIRYRLNRLREKGILKCPLLQTYERKLGLAEKLIFLRSVPHQEIKLKGILDNIPLIYHYASTYGRYEGFVVYSMFPIEEATIIESIVQAMKDSKLIEEYYVFELVDYLHKQANVDTFLKDSTWTWDTWYDEIDRIADICQDFEVYFEESPQSIDFDFKDIQILIRKLEDAEITMKELSENIELPQSQVHKRIKHLEEQGVLRGYKPAFVPFSDCTFFTIIIRSKAHSQEILCAFHRLPFQMTLAQEAKDHHYFVASIPNTDNDKFLKGLNRLKQYVDDMFVQTTLCHVHRGHLHLLSTYNQETKQWDIPVSDYVNMIRQASEK